ncbi:MAG: APC family permease [Puniceicoccales bacterium]|jgi:amino acid transporter|nr:APC family permease [Puniceicoccales bacterium]
MEKKSLSVLALVLVNVAAILSLRNLPLLSPYGLGMLFFYAVAAFGFFIPVALISAELAASMPEEGGFYAWMRAAFGDRIAFLCVWLSLITTVTALTMTLVFTAAALAHAIHPALADSRCFSCGAVVLLTWSATLVSLMGMRISALVTGLATVLGTCVPGLFIAVLGVIWLFSGRPLGLSLSAANLIPDFSSFANLSFLAGVFFAFAGMEMSAYHVKDVADPARSYPRAILYSTLLILALSLLGSLAIAIVIPSGELHLEAGAVQALTALLRQAHLAWLAPVLDLCIAFGGVAFTFAWIAGPARGLHATRGTGSLPPLLQRTNGRGMPSAILIGQAAVVTLCSLLFLLVPSISLGFWLLNAISAVLMLAMYLFLFLAGPILRAKFPGAARSYRIPGGRLGMGIVAIAGLASAAFGLAIAFVLPVELAGTISPGRFTAIVLAGSLLLGSPPFLFHALRRPEWKATPAQDQES